MGDLQNSKRKKKKETKLDFHFCLLPSTISYRNGTILHHYWKFSNKKK